MRLSELGPNATALYRVAFALPFLLLWLSLERRPARNGPPKEPRRIGRSDWLILALSGVFWSGDLVFWHWSITLTNVANSTFLACSSPIFVIVGARLIFGEQISRGFLAGFALTLIGGAALMGSSLAFGGGDLLGDMFGIVTAFFFGSYLLTIKHLRGNLPTGAIMFWSGVFSLPGLLLAALLTGEGFVAESLFGWSMIIGLALLAHVLGQGLAAYALAHLPASFASVAFLGEPVVAAILGWVILAEALGPLQAAGCVIILAGVWLAQRYGMSQRKRA
ncbi:MAG: DMT family transporter [Rhodospirillaceae bacterium]|nr:DMT family transporter [Rhodospirillaceae bacterium]MBT5677055.1 DMT family transporter [Rhodospirillaceae bacterium]MBT5779215.1 DMT family transporter [Rhodospirillaceae bacterium]